MNILLELTLFSVAVVGVIAFGIWKARDERRFVFVPSLVLRKLPPCRPAGNLA
jgi:hypothetical protein